MLQVVIVTLESPEEIGHSCTCKEVDAGGAVGLDPKGCKQHDPIVEKLSSRTHEQAGRILSDILFLWSSGKLNVREAVSEAIRHAFDLGMDTAVAAMMAGRADSTNKGK